MKLIKYFSPFQDVIENGLNIYVCIKSKILKAWLVTRRNREVIDFTRSRVKTKTKLTNLMKIIRIEGYNGK